MAGGFGNCLVICCFCDQLAQLCWPVSSVCLRSHDAQAGRGHWCVGPLMQRHPRGSTQIWAREVGCLSQKADCLLMVMSRNTFGISEPTAVHLLSALSPTFASSLWNSPEELSNNLIDSTAVNWRIPHYTHREEPWKSLWKNLFSQSVFYIYRSNSILSSYILWCLLIPDDHFLS